MSVTPDQIERFRDDGVVFSKRWLDLVERGIRRNLESPSARGGYADGAARGFFQDSDNWRRIAEFSEFAHQSPAKELAAALLGATKINFVQDHVLVKMAGAGKRTVWHQDQPYSPIDGADFCTMWLPVDPVSRDSTRQFVAGSHRSGA